MRKASREMDSQWALEVMRRAPYITVSFTRVDGSAFHWLVQVMTCGIFIVLLKGISWMPLPCIRKYVFRRLRSAILLWGRRTARLHFNIVRPSLLARRNG